MVGKIFDLLLAQPGIDVRIPTKTGMTALHFATRVSLADHRIVSQLLERAADANAVAKNGYTALSLARPHDRELRELLARARR